ncbi:hypothetical protein CXP54_09260 [Escherichia albertii]|nr:hypothetical protein CXP54_09260 [Escherichia albertii]EAB1451103.1 hypothetical protein [Escherichia albertii]EEW7340532.1 hypothetical protein [Escherichia albertii]
MISGARLHKVISQNQVKPVIKFRRKADLISKNRRHFMRSDARQDDCIKELLMGKDLLRNFLITHHRK